MWMLPRDNVYGPWPLSGRILLFKCDDHSKTLHHSGEIDIVESRGNGIRYTAQYVNRASTDATTLIKHSIAGRTLSRVL